MAKATINNFGLQSGTTNTLYATWQWSKSNTKEYKYTWQYYVDGIWFSPTTETTTEKLCTYDFPDNAVQIRFRVIPIAKTRKVRGKQTAYWKADWTGYKIYYVKDNPPQKPNTPEVEVKDFKLTAILDNLNVNATSIHFQVVKDNDTIFQTSDTTIQFAGNDKVNGYARYSCYLDAGSEYKVRVRSARDGMTSEWTDYTQNYKTKPSASSGITVCRANSETSVYLEWGEVGNATAYEIEYTTKKEYFDGSNDVTSQGDIKFTHFEVTGLESGDEYFFRVRATNSEGESSWSDIVSVTIGKPPVAPTTWSSTTTCIAGEKLTFYWVHNAEDSSTQTYAEVEMYVSGVKETHTVNTVNEEDDEKTMYFDVDTSEYAEGTKIEWRVRTAGVTKEYGEWSIQRVVDIYAPATLSTTLTDSNGDNIETVSSLPFYVTGTAGPRTQTPIGYHVVIVANEGYETVDTVGNTVIVSAGQEVYSKYFDTSEKLLVEFSAGNVDLENDISYTVTSMVTMDSGLTAESSIKFNVSWIDEIFEPDAEIAIDDESLTAIIRPYCEDEEGNLVEGVTLSVYRREFDGRFTELMSGLDNTIGTFITDPHPALDFARYRIVAISTATGAVSHYDVPAYPVGETSIVLQWAEKWSNFDVVEEVEAAEPTWSGSMIKLPYNVDVTDNNTADVSMVNYIGRSHPVTYYGTQLGVTSTWNASIPKDDIDTIYALRRLAIWMGDVYVREPSGTGYWANVAVSFNQKHREMIIPVTLNITRVEGGA